MSSFAGASRFVPTKGQGSFVTPAEAMLVAQRHLQWASSNVPGFEDWKRAKLSQPVIYYFPNGTKSAYEFTVLMNGKPDGFILVAAQRYMPQVLEFGKGEAPSKRLKQISKRMGISRPKFLYYGALSYSLRLENKTAITFGLKKVAIPDTVTISYSQKLVNTKDNTKYSILSSTYSEKHIEGVPAWTESDDGGSSTVYPYNVGPIADPWKKWDGCTPIAVSMVIAYYEPQLQNSWDREALIDVLHHVLKTSNNGTTWSYNVVSGIESLHEEYLRISKLIRLSHIVKNDYIAWWEDHDSGFYNAISDINNNHPVLLWMIEGGKSLDQSQDYNNHTVTVVGYVGYSGRFYWEIHDTWDNKSHYIADQNWKDAWFIFVHKR